MNFKEDTITAIVTPPGVGAISVIRVSGQDSIPAVDRIFSGSSPLSKARTHTLKYRKIVTTEGEILDDVVVSVFRSPRSYTGEDSVEISCHGNPTIT